MLTKTVTSEYLGGGDGDDVLTGIAQIGRGQIHVYAKGGNDIINLDFSSNINRFSQGQHARGDFDGSNLRGSDTINFQNTHNVSGGDVIVGRLEDFDSRDRIQIEGVEIDLGDLPDNVRIVEFNGAHNDTGASASTPQQWILITTSTGGYIFYALEGARIDMNGNGGANNGDMEKHFIHEYNLPDFAGLQDVEYVDPGNYIPAGYSPQGGVIINDDDNNAFDVLATISGSSAGDLIAAGLNDDTVYAGDGHDYVWGGSGYDVIFAGEGRDTIDAGGGRDRVFLSLGHDTFIDAEEDGHAGSDTVYGGLDHDTLRGAGGDDELHGMVDFDHIEGGAGNDTIYGGVHADTLIGGEGNDAIWGGMGLDRVDMGSGDDVFHGHPQDNELGQDTVFAGDGDDSILGGGGKDVFHGDGGNDLILGGLGHDTIHGSAGDDELHGMVDSDHIEGGAGNDTIYGGVHADTLIGGEGNDAIWGGMGLDRVDMGSGDDVFHGHPQDNELGQDTVFAGDGDDSILGGGGKDVFHGDGGNDLILAGLGHDTIHGGAGEDVIDSGRGLDVLTGGSGEDVFIFHQVDGFNTITDFGVGVDRLELDIGAPAIEDIEIEYWLKGTFLNWQDGQILLEGIEQSDFSIEDVFFI